MSSDNEIQMRFDMQGRLNKINFATNPLLPVFEAIINSIHSIDDIGIKSGKITVRIIRQPTPLFSGKNAKKEKIESLIEGFEVEDNGIGFTQCNFNHFLTVDTTHKNKRGGRGVGRLSWLKAFDNIVIDSSFLNDNDNEHRECRSFTFNLQKQETGIFVFERPSQLSGESSNRTIVTMMGFNGEYKERSPKRTSTVASRIIGHCVDYFLSDTCPQISVIDEAENEVIDLNDYFKQSILDAVTDSTFQINDHKFTVKHIRLRADFGEEHTLFYGANHRSVKSDNLAKLIPNLSSKLWGNNDEQKFVYIASVESPFLDGRVNETRTDFSIAADSDLLGELSWQQIKPKIIEECQKYIAPYLLHVEKTKRERIDKFVSEKAPQYRSILKYAGDKINSISPDIDDEKLDLELYGVYQTIQKQIREEGNVISASTNDSIEEYENRIQDYMGKVTDVNQSDLARYVCHRKVVLDYLQSCLEINQDGKYSRESDIHRAIFPMIATSEDTPFSNHNLWILDEKLVYHSFLASDKPISTYMESTSNKEPDLALFNNEVHAFSNVPAGTTMSSVTIIEFKRPMRDAYSKDENPIEQVYDYIRKIREGKRTTHSGRPINVNNDTPFFCYIICDITQKIRTWADDSGFIPMPDGQGYYVFNYKHKSYLEIMSFDKMLEDARKRQVAFFERLNITNAVKNDRI